MEPGSEGGGFAIRVVGKMGLVVNILQDGNVVNM